MEHPSVHQLNYHKNKIADQNWSDIEKQLSLLLLAYKQHTSGCNTDYTKFKEKCRISIGCYNVERWLKILSSFELLVLILSSNGSLTSVLV